MNHQQELKQQELKNLIRSLELCEQEMHRIQFAIRRLALDRGLPYSGFEKMLGVTAALFGVSMGDLTGRSRLAGIIAPRHVAFWIAHKIWGMSACDVAEFMMTDHTTILHGCKRITERRSIDESFRKLTDALIQQVRNFNPRDQAGKRDRSSSPAAR